jgi:hypothetical protein
MDVTSYFKSLSAELEAMKNRVRQFISDQHWLTDGEWKEGVLRNILRRNLPSTVDVGRGFIVTDGGVSRQIDVLIFDTSKPLLFRDGDLVFVTADAVEGVIEVKSSVNPRTFRAACQRLVETSELVLHCSPRHGTYHKFFSVFSYENEIADDGRYLEVLFDLSNEPNRLLHFFCLSKDLLIRFWEENPDNPQRLYYRWHSYHLAGIAPGYFIHNVVQAVCPHSVGENEALWFPIDGKERYRIGEKSVRWRPDAP